MTDLTKWPRLLVVGDAVTREQANEILIRTNTRHMHTNDRVWETTVHDLFGIARDKHGHPDWKSAQAFHDRYGVLDLTYLANQRIASSWLGGAYGWCDWDGTIGCSNYNIGKWPTVEDVTEEWQAIAAAFPYLTLHAQLVTDEGEGHIAATWAVKDGKTALVEPVGQIASISDDVAAMAAGLFLGTRTERGVSLDRLREALAQLAT
ncbi:hypothetical protein GCM10010156_49800 [Planobispora rosea]|uniref:Uncharacterized protein n=1 Tax=Planobispora rosea TaxID=35762 RepID=A0A8J3WG33_PLARO|nr:hypothetical protein [Planobispora rosea]GGS85224.1 hypothetical protein GCM10010156_49800 [Planobispora rosea]GIH86491.1 hypothetical protein Pro02_48990 [Planobispora rosea]